MMGKRDFWVRRIWAFAGVLTLILMSVGMYVTPVKSAAAANIGSVYVIPIEQKIERGLTSFMERGFKEAEEMEAGLIVLEINTPGGRVDQAEKIAKLIKSTQIPTVAYIRGDAASAGSFIALNADKIVMAKGSMIGAAEMVDGMGNRVEDAKIVAWWKSKMASAAGANGRETDIAEGMVDINMKVEMPEIGKTKNIGEIIALSADEALKVGYADKIAGSTNEVIEWMGYSTNDVFHMEQTFSEKLATFLTHPVVMTLLLFIGIAGVIIEVIVPGFGVPGILGTAAFVLYFFGNSVAGFAGSETWLLFIIGIGLLVMELFVPSFGILGIVGSGSLIFGVVRAAYSTSDVALSLGIAAACALVAIVVVALVFKERGIWKKFILSESLTKEQGYIPIEDRDVLIGLVGRSITPLRPSGTVELDGRRLDVVTEGSFIGSGRPVRVVKTDGTRIVVEEEIE
ncbi:membrane-bound serine protease (ClpP class) [Paenibacillus uliginis N3/975]|uniref:Membrane-bound serine protease (ClpP class) n=1 Tax=Paenibacillus uliginis N3/975 TaxID=1313296 RepID=A0A1X7HL39_9BACL|nr:nodulation protein NfeD [Paenibacillus uliginis]SMF88560.1 membrane-bound serine protease (ClpP class) [Paenibacillus uliginis N3/975]